MLLSRIRKWRTVQNAHYFTIIFNRVQRRFRLQGVNNSRKRADKLRDNVGGRCNYLIAVSKKVRMERLKDESKPDGQSNFMESVTINIVILQSVNILLIFWTHGVYGG